MNYARNINLTILRKLVYTLGPSTLYLNSNNRPMSYRNTNKTLTNTQKVQNIKMTRLRNPNLTDRCLHSIAL